ncbi:MAG: hypothetical protein WC516_01320 [Patescibacteria group bacterium]
MRITLDDNPKKRQNYDQMEQINYGRGHNHSCLKVFGCLIIVLAIIIFIVFLTIKLFIGPVINSVSTLPSDFPQEVAVYQLDQAKIKIQTPEAKEKILKLIESTPNWLLTPFLNYLSTNIKTQLADTFNNNVRVPQNFTVDELKKTLESPQLKQAQTVSLSWQNINKSKEELADYYKKQLGANNFQVTENLSDYQIDLGFWKDNIFGIISLDDSFQKDGQSTMDMTVNYLKKIK